MRGNADRYYGKRNALTLELDNNHLIVDYRMATHNSLRRSQKAARYLYNAGGSATSFVKNLLACRSFRNVSDDYINVSQTKDC